MLIPSACHAFLGAEYLGIDQLFHKQLTIHVPGGDCNWLSFYKFSESYEENRRNQKQEARSSYQKQVCIP